MSKVNNGSKGTGAQSNNANANHQANQANSNKGTSGTNSAYAAVHGNRGAQMNPNNQGKK